VVIPAMLAVIALGAWAVYRRRPESLWLRAREAINAGDRQAARLTLLQLLQRQPDHADAHLELAKVLLADAKEKDKTATYATQPEARAHLARASELKADDMELAATALEALIAARQPREAAAVARRMVKPRPDDVNVHYALAWWAVAQENWAEASQALDKLYALKDEPQVRTLILAFQTYTKSKNQEGQTKLAADLLAWAGKSDKLSGDDADALEQMLLGTINQAPDVVAAEQQAAAIVGIQEQRAAAGQVASAAELAIRVSQALNLKYPLAPDADRTAREQLDNRVVKLGEQAVESKVATPQTYRHIAALALSAGDEEKGMTLIQQGLAAAQGDSNLPVEHKLELHLMAARRLVAEGKFKSAQPHIQPLIDSPASAGWGHLLAGAVAMSEGRFETALDHLEKASSQLGETVMLRFAKARTLQALGQWERLLPVLASLHVDYKKLTAEERAWALHNLGEGDGVHLAQAQANLMLGRWEAAQPHFAAVAGTRSESPAIALKVAFLWLAGQRDQALQSLADGRARFPGDLTLARLEISILQQMGKVEEAERLVERLLAGNPEDLATRLLAFRWKVSRGQNQAALAELDQLIAKHPELPNLVVVKAQTMLSTGDAKGALELAEQLQQNAQTEQAGHLIAALAALKLQDLTSAAESLEEIGKVDRQVGAVDLLQGDLALARGNPEAALESLAGAMRFTQLRDQARLSILRSLSRLADEKSPAEAEARLEQLLKDNPDESILILARAELQVKQGKFALAQQNLDRLERLQPKSPAPPYFKARLLALQNQPLEAIDQLKRSLALLPEYVPARLMVANACLSTKRFEEAIEHAEIGMKTPGTHVAHLALVAATAHRQLNRPDQARRVLEALLKEVPSVAEAYLQLAELELAAKGPDQALAILAAGRKQLPENSELIQTTIRVLCERKRVDEAIKLADQIGGATPSFDAAIRLGRSFLIALQFGPARAWADKAAAVATPEQRPDVDWLLADIALGQGQTSGDEKLLAEARQHFSAVLEKRPGHTIAANNLAFLLMEKFKEPKLAQEVLEKARAQVNLRQAPIPFIDALLAAYRANGEEQKAAELIDAAIEAQPVEPKWLLSKADLAVATGRFDQAMQDLDRLQKLQPTMPTASLAKAQLWAAQNRGDQALAEVERALQLAPRHLPSLVFSCQQRLQLGKNEEALKDAQTVLQQDPQQWGVYLLQIEALARLGRGGEALQVAERLQAARPQMVEAYTALARLHRLANAPEKALLVLQQARAIAPADLEVLQDTLVTLLSLKRTAEADQIAQEVAAKSPTVQQCLAVGRAFHSGLQWDSAQAWAEKALAIAATDNDKLAAHWLAGDVALSIGQQTGNRQAFIEARDHYAAIVQMQPRHLIGANNLAWLLVAEFDEPEKALPIAETLRGDVAASQLPGEFVDTLVTIYRRLKRPDDALKLLETVAVARPNELQWVIMQADIVASQGEINRGLNLLRQIEARDASSPVGAILTARFLARRHRAAAALEEVKRALVLAPDHIEARLLAAELSLATGDASSAFDHVKAVLRQNPRLWSAYLLQASILRKLNRQDEALAVLRGVVENQPDSPAAYLALADAQSASNAGAALQTIQNGRARLPRDANLLVQEINLLCKTGKAAEALKQAEAYAGENPSAHVCQVLSRAFIAGGQHDTASAWAARAAKVVPDELRWSIALLEADIALDRGHVQKDQAALKAARDWYAQVLAARPKHIVAGNNLAWLLAVDFNEPAAALPIIEAVRGEAKVDELPVAFIDTLARVYRLNSRFADAQRLLEEALNLHPLAASLHFELGMLHAQSAPGQARVELQKALELGLPAERTEEAKKQLAQLDAMGSGK
jgi:tetratricopeptide (TPR) repeat protein